MSFIKHNMTASREYCSWECMKARCNNPKNVEFHRYGARGITICQEWNDSFERFYADMGPRPEGTTLDRIDPRGNYEPSNCRWATAFEQQQNTSTARRITYLGITRTISEWARETGISKIVIRSRVRRGEPPERVLYPGDLFALREVRQ